MNWYALFPSQILLEAPCNKMGLRRFKSIVKDWIESGECSAEIYLGKTWAGREFVCNLK